MENLDISAFIVAKSDQLNADDLIGGDITVQITGVTITGGKEQPVTFKISGGHKPWKPCKTTMRVLVFGWESSNAATYVGKWVRLYREPTVKWAGVETGGIRVSGMSGIKSAFEVALAETKGGKKQTHKVSAIKPPTENATQSSSTTPAPVPPMDLDKFRQWIGDAIKRGWTRDQIARLLKTDDAAAVPPDHRRELVGVLKGKPSQDDDSPPVDDDSPPAGFTPTPEERAEIEAAERGAK